MIINPSRMTETRHHPKGKTCHHYEFHRLTCDEYDHLRSRASGACEICGTSEEETGGKRLVVDHFQGSSPNVRLIRGMLCDRCNSVMSCMDETKSWGPKTSIWREKAMSYEAMSWRLIAEDQQRRVFENRELRRRRREGPAAAPTSTFRPQRDRTMTAAAESAQRFDQWQHALLDRPDDVPAATPLSWQVERHDAHAARLMANLLPADAPGVRGTAEDALAVLVLSSSMRRDLERSEGHRVHEALTLGATWGQVADALDITPTEARGLLRAYADGQRELRRHLGAEAHGFSAEQHSAAVALTERGDSEGSPASGKVR